jgi:hypothetical protein
MMSDKNWFQKKWGAPKVPIDILLDRVEELEDRLMKLEEENIETSNVLYELIENIRAVDARIDIIAENPWGEQFDV